MWRQAGRGAAGAGVPCGRVSIRCAARGGQHRQDRQRHLLPPRGSAAPVRGFDTGPGNTLLDAWCRRRTGKDDDEWPMGGDGKTDDALLLGLLADRISVNRRRRAPDVSASIWRGWTPRCGKKASVAPADVQATLTALTRAQSVWRLAICPALCAAAACSTWR